MLTIETLNDFGVNTKEGLTRCMNNEKFYFKMLKMGLASDQFEKLGAQENLMRHLRRRTHLKAYSEIWHLLRFIRRLQK